MSWKSYKLGELLERKRIKADITPHEEYKLVTIKLRHQGVVLRGEKKGSDIKSNMFHVNEGDFILSGIDARNGAFGIVPKELDGAVVTNDFWCLEPKKGLLRKDFFLFITSTKFFDYICNQCSDGTTQRIRLQKEKFYDFEITLPDIDAQGDLVKALAQNKKANEVLSTELTHQLDLVQQLRQAFLKEAMQGKLTEDWRKSRSSSGDEMEPASVLLEKIKAEKDKWIKEKVIKKPKPIPPILDYEIPFDIPKNWTWCRLGEFAYVTSGSTPKSSAFVPEGIPFLKMYNLREQKIDFDYKQQFIKEEVHNGALKRCRAFPGDLIMNIVGPPLGKLAIIPDSLSECNFNQAAVLIRPTILEMNKYLFWYLSEMSEINEVETKGVAGQNNISVTQAHNMKIPLPPLSEQQRIVVKLDELMAFCDRLETSIKESQTQNELLLQQVLREALEPSSANASEGGPKESV